MSSCLVVGNIERFAEQIKRVYRNNQLMDLNETAGTLGQLLRKLPEDLKTELVNRLMTVAAAHNAVHEMKCFISHYVKGTFPPVKYEL